MIVKLLIDYVSWITATFLLFGCDYPNIAALVGATGTVYLKCATQRYIRFLIKAYEDN